MYAITMYMFRQQDICSKNYSENYSARISQPLPAVGDFETFSSSVTKSNTDSAANMPLFIALWVPFIFGTFINPGLHPIKQPPGKVSLGMDYTCKKINISVNKFIPDWVWNYEIRAKY